MRTLPPEDQKVFRDAFRRNAEKSISETYRRNAEKWFELCERTGNLDLTVDQAVALIIRQDA